ncbi:MAG: hypothetical protein ACXW2W_17330 [Telluria sp.]
MVAGAAFVILAAVGLLKGRTLAEAWLEALGWALASATVFIVARYRSARRGEACALCRDTVED